MKKETNTHKHKHPSRIRYERKNPNITVRMPKEWIEDMNKYLQESGVSRRQFLGLALKKLKASYTQVETKNYNAGFDIGFEKGKEIGYNDGYIKGIQEGFTLGHEEGYKKGINDFAIDVPCYKCGNLITIKPNTVEHSYLIYCSKGGICHQQCLP